MKINGKPDGGGGSAVITGLSVTENGIYIATGVDGYSPVEVDVPIPSFVTESLSVTSNGTYTPGEGIDGYSQVSVDVQPTLGTLSVSVNNTYYPGQGVDGFSQVVVDVPQSVSGYTEKNITEGTVNVVNLNNSASFVATNAFNGNNNLQTVNLPNCNTVRASAFQYCRNLSQVNLPVCERIALRAFSDCTSLTSVSVPSLKSVGDNAFTSCSRLSYISLPEVTYMSNGAFYYCQQLQTVYAPNCSMIGQSAFQNCYSLTDDVTLTNCVSIASAGFQNCISLISIDLPSLIYMDNSVFNRCRALESISLPAVWVGGLAFDSCTSLRYINLPDAVYVSGAVVNSYPLDTVSIPAFLSTSRWFTNGVLLYASISTVYLGTECYGVPSYGDVVSGTTTISSLYVNAYEYSNYLTAPGWSDMSSQIFPDPDGDPNTPMLAFENGTVYGNTKGIASNFLSYLNGPSNFDIQKVSLPNCVGVMPYTFRSLSNLSEVYLPNCKYLGNHAFEYCSNLTNVKLEYDGICFISYNTAPFMATPNISIYVPASLVDAYKADSTWAQYSNRIFPIPE